MKTTFCITLSHYTQAYRCDVCKEVPTTGRYEVGYISNDGFNYHIISICKNCLKNEDKIEAAHITKLL